MSTCCSHLPQVALRSACGRYVTGRCRSDKPPPLLPRYTTISPLTPSPLHLLQGALQRAHTSSRVGGGVRGHLYRVDQEPICDHHPPLPTSPHNEAYLHSTVLDRWEKKKTLSIGSVRENSGGNGQAYYQSQVTDQCNFTDVTPEWSDSEAPAVKVTGVYLYSPVTGSRPALFHRYFFAPSLFKKKEFSADTFHRENTSASLLRWVSN